VVDRHRDTATETLAAITAAGGRGCAIVADISDEAQVEGMVAECLSRFGKLDCAFNNAGIGGAEVQSGGRKLGEIEKPAWDKIIAINLTGVWLCLKSEVAAMQGAGGAIVNTASIAGLVGLAGSGPYSASKHGVIGLTKAAAIEYAGAGIRVNAICPGYVVTPLTRETLERTGDRVRARLPINRLAEADEIAELAIWLCSAKASYVTGAAYTIDGGYVAGF